METPASGSSPGLRARTNRTREPPLTSSSREVGEPDRRDAVHARRDLALLGDPAERDADDVHERVAHDVPARVADAELRRERRPGHQRARRERHRVDHQPLGRGDARHGNGDEAVRQPDRAARLRHRDHRGRAGQCCRLPEGVRRGYGAADREADVDVDDRVRPAGRAADPRAAPAGAVAPLPAEAERHRRAALPRARGEGQRLTDLREPAQRRPLGALRRAPGPRDHGRAAGGRRCRRLAE